MPNKPKMKVYYNSACPVCNAGIESQKGKPSDCEIQWNDVHNNNSIVSELNSDIEYVRERLHVMDENGQVQVGFDAFLAIWRHSPSESWKSKLLRLTPLRQLSRFAYNLFAAALYKWNKYKRHW